MKLHRCLLAVFLVFTGWAGVASAANFSFSNNLASDNAIATFTFTVAAPQTVTLRTWSYAGGVNAAGTTIPRGGFDPILAVFDSTGLLIDQNDDGDCGQVATDPITGECYDTYLVANLPAAGTYTVTVMQFDNFATGPNLSDGFDGTSATNFDGRTSFWAFDILNADSASGPPVVAPSAPATVPTLSQWAIFMLVALMGLLGAGAMMRRRQRTIS